MLWKKKMLTVFANITNTVNYFMDKRWL